MKRCLPEFANTGLILRHVCGAFLIMNGKVSRKKTAKVIYRPLLIKKMPDIKTSTLVQKKFNSH